MVTDAVFCDEQETTPSRAEWMRIDSAAIDVLDIEALETREWVFACRGRVVVQPLTDGVEEATCGALAPSSVVVGCAGAAPIRISSSAGSSFRVMFEDLSTSADAVRFRLEVPQLLPAAGADPESVFEAASSALRVASPIARRIAPPLAHARRFIEQHLEEDFDLHTLSSAAGIGRCHLSRTYARVFGLSPYRYRTHLRLARARELLREGLGCSDVAFAVGFCDQSHLTRSFKEFTGTTPGTYARAIAHARSSRSALAA